MHGHEHTISLFTRVRVAQLERQVRKMRMRHEREIAEKDEAIGELLEQLDHADLVPFCMRCLMDAR